MDSPTVSAVLQMTVPLALDTGLLLKTREKIWLVTRSSFFLKHCNCSHHLSGKRRNLLPVPQAVPENLSWPAPADLQQDGGPPEA